MTWLNGSTYDGLWKNDCMHDMRPAHKVNSKFVCQIENGGYVYVGNWDMGIRTGQGMMRNLSPEETYVGGWDMDSYNGFGSYETEYHRYDGQFLHGKKHGVGTLTSRSDGSFHKGMWRNDLFHGQNQQVYNAETDQLFVGVFEDNKRGIGSVQSNFRGIRR